MKLRFYLIYTIALGGARKFFNSLISIESLINTKTDALLCEKLLFKNSDRKVYTANHFDGGINNQNEFKDLFFQLFVC